jgi:hypothetical protein
MVTLPLKAHFDGMQILLDEPFDLPKDAPLLVTILPVGDPLDAERTAWYELGKQSLARAYGDDEPEYTLEDVKP